MKQIITIAYNDFRLIFRDNSLRVFLLMPVLVLLLVRYFCPYLSANYPMTSNYIIYIVIMSCTQTSTMYGFIYGNVFLDERDTEVAKLYGILPVSRSGFVFGRMLMPYLLSTITTAIILFAQPIYPNLTVVGIFLFAALFGLFAPVLALLVGSLATNKMEGMTWFKGINLLVSLPLVAFFLPDYAYFFAVIPTFWAYTGMFDFITTGTYALPLIVGFVFTSVVLIGLVRLFVKRHFV